MTIGKWLSYFFIHTMILIRLFDGLMRSIAFPPHPMRPLKFSLDGLGENSLSAGKLHDIFMFWVVQHLNGVSFKNILHFVVLEHLVEFPLLLAVKSEIIHSVDFDSFVNISSFLDNIFVEIISFVVWIDIVEIDNFVLFLVGKSWQFTVDQIWGKAKSVQKNKVDIFRFFFVVFERLGGNWAIGDGDETFYQVVKKFINCAE